MVTFFHGLIGSPANWNKVIKLVSPENQPISTPYLDYMYGTDVLINDILSQIDFGATTKIAIGNSLGCYIALRMGNLFDRIILTSPPYTFCKGSVFLSNKNIDKLERDLFDSPLSQENREEFQAVVRKWGKLIRSANGVARMRQIKHELTQFDFSGHYEKHQQKIHFVLGGRDQITPCEEFVNFAKRHCPAASVHVLDRCGHAIPMEKPAELASIINQNITQA